MLEQDVNEMMQLAVTFCSLFFNPTASILGPDTEICVLMGAISLNMDFWSSHGRGYSSLEGMAGITA